MLMIIIFLGLILLNLSKKLRICKNIEFADTIKAIKIIGEIIVPVAT